MKKQILISLLMGFVFLSAFNMDRQLLPTALKITVRNDLGNPVENAKVTLYANENDYRNNKNPVAEPAMTDAKGEVRFKNLNPIAYFVDVEKGDLSNIGGGTQTARLDKGKLNKVTIVIQ